MGSGEVGVEVFDEVQGLGGGVSCHLAATVGENRMQEVGVFGEIPPKFL